MPTPRYAWGIDIGNRALKAIRLSQGPDGLRIDDFDVVEHEQVLSNAGDNKESLIQSALANFVQRHELKGAPVAIGVSGQSSFARFIKLPPVEPKKIPEIVRFEAIQQIPFPLDEVEWSYQLFQEPQSPDVEVGIFAMRKELVNHNIKYFTDMGLDVQLVQMNPLAVYNAMYHDQRLKGTTMVVDLGAENTDLIIAEGETIWLRSIPIGGNNFTEALVKAFKLKFPKAEELKRNAPTSKYGRQILQAMRPVFNDLVAEIQRSIGFYASVHRESRISRVLALGGTFRLPGLQKYVQQNLQIDVHRIDRLGAGAPDDARVATIFSENILSSVSAYGLAMQALGQGKINSSLLPLKIRREKMWQQKTLWFGAAAAIFIAAILLCYGAIYWGNRNEQQTQNLQNENDRAAQQADALDKRWDTEVENAGAPDRARTANYGSLMQGRQLQPTLIADITSALPDPGPLGNLKNIPRAQRPLIRISRLTEEYREDVSPITAMPRDQFKLLQVAGAQPTTPEQGPTRSPVIGRFGRQRRQPMQQYQPPPPTPGSTDSSSTPAAPKQRGFLIELVCTTPNSGGASYVLSTLVPKLSALGQTGPVTYKMVRVEVPSSMRLADDPSIQQQQQNGLINRVNPNGIPVGRGQRGISQQFNQAPYLPPNVAPTTEPSDTFNPLIDPATKEDMSNDTRVVVLMEITLDPPATDKTAGQTPTVAQANQ